jgi:type II secretory pathway pseudopilin PulG
VAIVKSTRSKRARARSTASCPPPARQSQPRIGAAFLVPSLVLGTERSRQLSLVIPRLRAIYGMAITAELALRQQAVEQNPEVADCLRVGVCDPIADQIRALEEVTAHSPDEASSTEL